MDNITSTIENIDNYIIPVEGGNVDPAIIFVAQYDPIVYHINFDAGNPEAEVWPSDHMVRNIKSYGFFKKEEKEITDIIIKELSILPLIYNGNINLIFQRYFQNQYEINHENECGK